MNAGGGFNDNDMDSEMEEDIKAFLDTVRI